MKALCSSCYQVRSLMGGENLAEPDVHCHCSTGAEESNTDSFGKVGNFGKA
jgi:hypothetical protein